MEQNWFPLRKWHKMIGAGNVGLANVEGDLNLESDIGIILPTYCEAANIDRLIHDIEKLNLDLRIMVIDDSSRDGTEDAVRELQKEYENILLMVRPQKSGLGTAITDGFKEFLKLKNPPKYIVTMDADYSHNPKDLPRLIAPLEKDCDLVIGSRYCKGGSTLDWSLFRRTISKMANFVASTLIGAKICDYTSGMRCYSTRLVQNIIGDLHSETYEIQIETIRQSHLRGFRIGEIPITFANRKKGESKLSFNEITQFLSYTFLKPVIEFRRNYRESHSTI